MNSDGDNIQDYDSDHLDDASEAKVFGDHPNVKIIPPMIYALTFLAAFLMEMVVGTDFFRWGAQLLAGLFFLSFGTGLMTWSVAILIRSGTNVPTYMPTKKIVTRGPYSFTRNPIYIGLTCVYVGFAFLFDIVWAFIFIGPLIYFITKYVIFREEEYLEKKFGDVYLEYKADVRRW